MKILFIVNEQAGKGKTRKFWPKIQNLLREYGVQYEVRFTTKPKEAIAIAQHAATNQFSNIVAVGGDGTVNEVVNGLAGQQTRFGILPTGTGNDFARMLNIPRDPGMAVKRLANGTEKSIDLMELNGMYVAGAIGIGLDGAVAEDVNRKSWMKKAGAFGYILSMIRLTFQFPPFTLYMKIDGETKIFRNCWMAVIGNSKYYAGGMQICPNAVHDDGLLDVCVVHKLSRLELLKLLPSVFSGKHVCHPDVITFRGKEIHIRTHPLVPVHGDGELLGKTPSDILVRPQVLHVISEERTE